MLIFLSIASSLLPVQASVRPLSRLRTYVMWVQECIALLIWADSYPLTCRRNTPRDRSKH